MSTFSKHDKSNELHEVNLLYSSLFHHSTDAIEIIDLEGHVFDLNPACCIIFGVNPEKTIGKISTLYKYVESRSFLDLSIHTVDDYIKGQNGITYYARMIFTPILNQSKEKIGYTITIRDMTSHKQLIHSLRENERLYRLLADNSEDLIQIVNLDGDVVYASPSHKKILGRNPDEFSGKNINYHPNKDFRSAFRTMTQELKTITFEAKVQHENGDDIWIEVKGTPVFDQQGNFEHFMMVGHNITDRKRSNERLKFLATHDPLTKLPNRRLFTKNLSESLKEAREEHRDIAIMILDLDGFKKVNDDYGHDVGDELLKTFSNRVKQCIRKSDTLARIGGDEFVLLLSDLDNADQVYRIADRIIASLQDGWNIIDYTIRTTSSIGIAFYQTGENIKDFMKRADLALYEAKSNGKNNYKVSKN
ncbi:diguanylate cyclase [Filobacillus milosensis]|uniref:Diguanylate cyclase n=1 Tax=Filobacillus milosensis TaxID=94137 RepID=A0A4Y8IGH4_9BACI|nr:sensor domain-containing diguanylate cyclase [Filobacillus milosensis]TFB14214.1 diguanylate cyclase [Filobacillus milosensis]